jgi:hypothetical protein
MASPSCLPTSDDVFGPIVKGCRSNFDFTLLFEQAILTIGPAVLLLLFVPPRIIRLLRSNKKTLSSRPRLYKTVIPFLSSTWNWLIVSGRLRRVGWRSAGHIDILVQEPAHQGSAALLHPRIPCRHRNSLLISL